VPLGEIKKVIVSARGSILKRFLIHPVKISKIFWIPASFGLLTASVNSITPYSFDKEMEK